MDARPSPAPRVALAAALVLALAGPMAASPAAAANREERHLRRMVNDSRENHRVRSLKMRRFLVRAARHHSREMAATGALVHSTDLASVPGDRPWRLLGENIGVGSSMEVLHQAFMDSPPHRQNQLNRVYRFVGVGMARSGDGRLWVTVLFLG
ncbi:MAG TPA: CAP domain-containing protein [Actinomycetota bacterium]|nr:CAP domain-containing protein [Actinomycetota bacterium]